MNCLADPIGADVGCLPASLISVPSRKVKCTANGTLSTSSTNGNGFILIRPGQLLFNNAVAIGTVTAQNAITYTTASFTGNSFAQNTNTAPAGSVVAAATNSEYTTTDCGSGASATTGIQWRMVACAIEIEATTPWSSRGGLCTGICEPNHYSLNGQLESDVNKLDGAWRDAVSSGGDSKFVLKYAGPADPKEFEFTHAYLGDPDGTSLAIDQCNPYMGIFISGPNSQTYSWKVVGHFEVIGAKARGKTVTWPDPHGAAVASTIMSKAHAENGGNHHDSPGFWGTISSALHEGIKMTSSGLDKVAGLAKSATHAIEALPGPSMLMKYGVPALEQYAGMSSGRAAPRVAARPSAPAIMPRSVPRIAAKPSVKAIKPKKR